MTTPAALTHRCNQRLWASLALRSAAIALVLTALAGWLTPISMPTFVGVALLGTTVSLGVIALLEKGKAATDALIAQHLNRAVPELEESAELLFAPPANLTLLERLQQKRITAKAASLNLEAVLPNPMTSAIHFFALGAVAACLLVATQLLFSKEPNGDLQAASNPSVAVPLPPNVESVSVTLAPPRYTAKPVQTVSRFDLSFLEHSRASFEIRFSTRVASAWLVFNSDDTLRLKNEKGKFIGSKILDAGGFYVLHVEDEQGRTQTSDYHKLEMLRDNAPTIVISEPDQRSEIDILKTALLPLTATIHDDYGIAKTKVVAVITQGKGENVKFREQILSFESIAGEKYSRQFDLKAFGLAPGDELYLHVEAADAREPKPNWTRSETHIVSIKDTAASEVDFSMSLPIAAQPDYFRSQRQIIIDTEKLLREKKTLSEKEFNARSENIGIDQKVLRLRYGKFLGEEFESAIGGVDVDEIMKAATPKDSVVHPLMKFIKHVHDANCGHDVKSAEMADKNPNEESVEKLMSRFTHAHDTEEGATFYSDGVKAQLKAALAEMWEAELYLRMHKPADAIPFELNALKLLKDLQQKSRVYVQRVGFEPPPLKPDEKRLSGKLDKIQSSINATSVVEQDNFQTVRLTLAAIQKATSGGTLTGADIQALERGGQALGDAARNEPTRYLAAMRDLRLCLNALAESGIAPALRLASVERALLTLLPPAEPRLEQTPLSMSSVAKAYFNSFGNAK